MSAEGPTGPEVRIGQLISRNGKERSEFSDREIIAGSTLRSSVMKNLRTCTGAAEKRSRLKQKKVGAGWNGGPCRGLRGHATWRGLKLKQDAGESWKQLNNGNSKGSLKRPDMLPNSKTDKPKLSVVKESYVEEN